MSNVANWVEETTSTTGVGDITLSGSPAGSSTFKQAFGDSPVSVYYAIENGNNREAGIGTFDGNLTLTRDTVKATLVAGVYDDVTPTAIALSGTSNIRCTFNASAFRDFPLKPQTGIFSFGVDVVENKDYRIIGKLNQAITIIETTSICDSGTCTATFKLDDVALGGTANAVSSVEQDQAHSSNNVGAIGDEFKITVSGNSSCVGMTLTIKFNYDLV